MSNELNIQATPLDTLQGIHKVYFIGIGGIGMSAIAEILLAKSITPGGRVGDNSPLAKPGSDPDGPRRLVDYVREVAHALMRKGTPKSKAIAMARGILRNWAEGKGDVSPKVRAAAAKALAEQAALDKRRGKK